jgi:hypothetical protein
MWVESLSRHHMSNQTKHLSAPNFRRTSNSSSVRESSIFGGPNIATPTL